MKKVLIVIASVLILMTSCKKDPEMVYEPSKFPTESKKNELGVFKIPITRENGTYKVLVRVNGKSSYYAFYDTGCNIPLTISSTEYIQMVKEGALDGEYVLGKGNSKLADGSTSTDKVITIKQISISDVDGKEHVIKNIHATVSPNPNAPVIFGTPLMEALGSSYEISQNEDVIIFKE